MYGLLKLTSNFVAVYEFFVWSYMVSRMSSFFWLYNTFFFFQFYPTFFSNVFDFFSNVYGSLKFTPNFISCIRLLKEVSYFLVLYGFIFNRKRFFFNRMWLCLNRLRLFLNRLRPFFNRIRVIKINSNFLVAYGIFV